MNLRNALYTLLVLGLSLTVATGQQGPTEISSPDAQTATAPPDLRIRFTGYLLGYYRVPDLQSADFLEHCPDPQQPEPSEAAKLLLQELGAGNSDKALLVGMGDNFAVELGSRTYGNFPSSGSGTLYAKQRNPGLRPPTGRPGDAWPPLFAGDEIGDNVACFLSLAGYDAIIPGKEDFYFGPERLQRIAQRLAAVPDPPSNPDPTRRAYHPVPMLAANLIVRNNYWVPPDKIPEVRHQTFTPGFPNKVEGAKIKGQGDVTVGSKEITDHGVVLPFLQTINLEVEYKTKEGAPGLRAWLCKLPQRADPETEFDVCVNPKPSPATNSNPDEILVRSQPEKADGSERGSSQAPDEESKLEFMASVDGRLDPDTNFGLCLNLTAAGAAQSGSGKIKPYCVRFTVARPFLQPFGCVSGDAPVTNCCTRSCQLPYVYKPERKTVIFGVVDPALKGAIGRDNLSWKNRNSKYSSSVDFMDTAPALHQAMQLFSKDPRLGGADVSKVRKILLAQMSRDKAEALAVRLSQDDDLRFDLVFSSASDYDRSSPDGRLHLNPRQLKTGPIYPPTVVTTWGTYFYDPDGSDGHLVDPLRTLEIRDLDVSGRRQREITLEGGFRRWDDPHPDPHPDPNSIQKIYSARKVNDLRLEYGTRGQRFLCPRDPHCGTDLFRLAVLQIMRTASGADIAMLQKRDIFWGPFRTSQSPGEELERLLWKGDVLRVLSVTGATLQKVLKESDAFDQSDLTGDAVTQGRGLVYLGLEATQDESYVIDGALLDKNRVYTIATSNYITAGDTGYPELANPDDPDLADKRLPSPPRDITPKPSDNEVEGRRISELVCVELTLSGCVTLDVRTKPATGDALFAASSGLPTDDKPKSGKIAEVWLLHVFDTALFSDPPSTPEIAAQDQARWHLAVNQISFGYKLSTNNLSEANRAQLFNGFTEAGVQGANSHSWTNATQIELVHRGRRLEEYLRSQSDYSSTVQEQAPPATLPSVSRDKNRYQFDAGLFYHPFTFCLYVLPFCHSHRKEYPENGFIFEPFRFDSPIVKELVDIGANGPTPQPLTLDRTQRLLMRTGWRTETAKFHFETGFEGGWKRGALDEIVTSQGTCVPMPSESFGECLANLATPVANVDQVRSTRSLYGFYLDWKWSSPLPFLKGWQSKPWTNTLQAQGDWFPFGPSDDNSSDTRYLYDMTEKFSIPLPSSLSFQPSLEYFRYRNKFGPDYLRRWSPQATISWSFDFYSGGKWGKSVKHKGGGGASGSSDSE